jgi:hypothetical protein
MGDYGYHWTPCRGGGGGAAVLVVLAVIVAAADGRAIGHAVTDLVEIAAVTVGVLLVVAVAVAVTVWRVRRRRELDARQRRELDARRARPVVLTAVREPAELGDGQVPAAIEAPRPGTFAYPPIDASPHVVTSRPARPRCAHRDGRRS